MTLTPHTCNEFNRLVKQIPKMGIKRWSHQIVDNATLNTSRITKSIKTLPPLQGEKANSAIVISAGPSNYRKNSIKRICESKYLGTIISVDGAYLACLKSGLIPDYVMTLDPNLTRIVRWFGDHEFLQNSRNDDYFSRQDLDVEFRKNTLEQNEKHIGLVNKYGHLTKAIVASCSPPNVVQRILEAKFDAYGWNPLVDEPNHSKSLTRHLYQMNQFPCLNTGGTVGTSAWIFAQVFLKIPHVALVGMDLGYYRDTPFHMTQTYYELLRHAGDEKNLSQYFVEYTFPSTQEKFYTDPTYYWYRNNLLELLKCSQDKLYNCTEGGTLFGPGVECTSLDNFLWRKFY